jgi:hypothetical protein
MWDPFILSTLRQESKAGVFGDELWPIAPHEALAREREGTQTIGLEGA